VQVAGEPVPARQRHVNPFGGDAPITSRGAQSLKGTLDAAFDVIFDGVQECTDRRTVVLWDIAQATHGLGQFALSADEPDAQLFNLRFAVRAIQGIQSVAVNPFEGSLH
jgi:hypothetical protein